MRPIRHCGDLAEEPPKAKHPLVEREHHFI
jgi:hypothetical protein